MGNFAPRKRRRLRKCIEVKRAPRGKSLLQDIVRNSQHSDFSDETDVKGGRNGVRDMDERAPSHGTVVVPSYDRVSMDLHPMADPSPMVTPLRQKGFCRWPP